MYATVLLIVHVLFAVIGFGPTMAFSVLGPMVRDAGPGAGVLLQSMVGIQRRFVIPASIILPVTGVLLLVERGYDRSLQRHTWLWLAMLVYAVALVLAYGFQNPTLRRMVDASAKGGGPEMAALGRRAAAVGAVQGIILVVLIVLMVWKPTA